MVSFVYLNSVYLLSILIKYSLIVLSNLIYTGTPFDIFAFMNTLPMSTTATCLLSCAAIAAIVNMELVKTVGEDMS